MNEICTDKPSYEQLEKAYGLACFILQDFVTQDVVYRDEDGILCEKKVPMKSKEEWMKKFLKEYEKQ